MGSIGNGVLHPPLDTSSKLPPFIRSGVDEVVEMEMAASPLDRRIVDLRSDTVTKPTAAMREAMASAEVDDDILGVDPTVFELQKQMAQIFGKEEGLFVPSGTMGNLIAVLVHCEVYSSLNVENIQSLVYMLTYEADGAKTATYSAEQRYYIIVKLSKSSLLAMGGGKYVFFEFLM